MLVVMLLLFEVIAMVVRVLLVPEEAWLIPWIVFLLLEEVAHVFLFFAEVLLVPLIIDGVVLVMLTSEGVVQVFVFMEQLMLMLLSALSVNPLLLLFPVNWDVCFEQLLLASFMKLVKLLYEL